MVGLFIILLFGYYTAWVSRFLTIVLLIGQSFAQSHRATKYDFGAQAALIAEALARKALALNVKNGGAWHALGFSLDAQGRIDEALRAYEQAIAINSDDHNAVSSAAYLLQVQGRLHEALVLEQSIMRKGKRSQFTFLQIASALHLAGFETASQKWLARAETLTPETLPTSASSTLATGSCSRSAADTLEIAPVK